MAENKSYNIKVFDQDGSTAITNWSAQTVKNTPQFTSKINGGFGECVLDLDLPFDDFGEGNAVNFMNIVDIYAVDSDSPRGTRIYRGFVSQYEPYIEGRGEEGVRVSLLGLGSMLTFSYYKNGTSYTVNHTTQDPETIGRAIIDHFNTIYGGSLLTYDGDSTDPVGTTVNMDFVDQKWFDSLRRVGEVSGTGWWWKIDENGKYWLKDKPSSVTHKFTIGKDIVMIQAPKDSEKVVNDVQVRWSAGNVDDSDATSQQTYGSGSSPTGKRSKIITDSNLTSSAAGTQRASKEIADNKDAKVKAVLTINDNYDLESIKVGETCKIQNYNKDSTFFDSNMLIVGLNYQGDTTRLELEGHPANFGVELDSFVNG